MLLVSVPRRRLASRGYLLLLKGPPLVVAALHKPLVLLGLPQLLPHLLLVAVVYKLPHLMGL